MIIEILKNRENKKIVGNTIYYSHLILSIIFGFIMLCVTHKPLVLFFIFLLIIHNISFIYFRGCLITKIENMLLETDSTVIDPLLKILGMTVSNKNRYNLTVFGIIITWIILINKI